MFNKKNVLAKAVVLALLVGLVPLFAVLAQDTEDTTATEEANKEVVSRFLQEGFTTGDIDVLTELVSPDFVDNEEGSPFSGEFSIEAMSEATLMLVNAIEGFEVEIIDIIAEDDKVAVIAAWTGTHTGDFMGMPATGNDIYVPVFDLFRVEDGMIVEHWGVTDNFALFTQFGAIPMPEME